MKISAADNTSACENCKWWKDIPQGLTMQKQEFYGSCMLVDNEGHKVRGATKESFSCEGFEEGQFDGQEFNKWYQERFGK